MKITISCDDIASDRSSARIEIDPEGKDVSGLDIVNLLVNVILVITGEKKAVTGEDFESILSNIGGFDGLKN